MPSEDLFSGEFLQPRAYAIVTNHTAFGREPMTTLSSKHITQLLQAWNDGSESALDELVPLVRAELKRLAKHYMLNERAGHLLQTTALVNETYMRLIDWKSVSWQSRTHFFGVSARLMRNILVDCARGRPQVKGGGEAELVSLEEALVVSEDRSQQLLAIDDALTALEKMDPRKSRIVELRFFGGLSVKETAEVLKVSRRTVIREWTRAKVWLHHELSQEKCNGA